MQTCEKKSYPVWTKLTQCVHLNLTSVRETETENILSKFQDVHFIDQFKEYKYCQINETQLTHRFCELKAVMNTKK